MDLNAEIETNLSGQTIIVTGGTRGIGLGIVRVLARAGAELMVTGRKPARLESLSEELTEAGQTQLTVTPYWPHSRAAVRVRERTASFAAEYGP